MTPALQTIFTLSTSFGIPGNDLTNLLELYLWTVQLGVTDSQATIFKNAADVMQLSPEQRQLIRCFALAKHNNLDTNWQGQSAVVVNNLYTGPNAIDPGRAAAALDYVIFRGLGVL
jgi:hypothetical protein